MRSESVIGEVMLLRAEVVGIVLQDETMLSNEVYLVFWSDVSVRGGGGFEKLRGRRNGVLMAPEGVVLSTVAVSGTGGSEGCAGGACDSSGIADPFICFSSIIEDRAGGGAAMLKISYDRQWYSVIRCTSYIYHTLGRH